MPIIRNPFRKSPADFYHHEDAAIPVGNGDLTKTQDNPHCPKQSNVFSSLSSKPVKVPAQGTDKQPAEYQLCEINDSGVFLPPTPPERQSFWQSSRSTASRSSSYRSASILNENEPFSISRESFDSYRRSFDICARSPVTLDTPSSPRARRSIDCRPARYPVSSNTSVASPAMPRMSPPRLPDMSQAPLRDSFVNPPASLEEDIDGEKEESSAPAQAAGEANLFEDVGLNDDKKAHKKRGFFSSHFGNSSSSANAAPQSEDSARPGSSSGSHAHNHTLGSLFGRKRGASGQGAELGRIQSNEKPSNSPLSISASAGTDLVAAKVEPTATSSTS